MPRKQPDKLPVDEQDRKEDEEHDALRQLELAEAELAAVRQELVLRHLIDTDKPIAQARAAPQGVRDVASDLAGRRQRA